MKLTPKVLMLFLAPCLALAQDKPAPTPASPTPAPPAAAVPAAAALAGDAAKVGILPSQRERGILIPDDGAMPFGVPMQRKQSSQSVRRENTQEDQIREVFSRIRVSGVTNDGQGGKQVLAGDLILEKGKPVDQILLNQTDQLFVSEITDKEVEISWVERTGANRLPRTLKLAIDLDPKVRFLLKAQEGGQRKQLGIEAPRSTGPEEANAAMAGEHIAPGPNRAGAAP